METVELSLKIGALIDDRYRIDGVLGEGGFGVTYKAYDQELDYTVVIKEYLPQECASRAGDSITVQARTNRADDYQYGLERFLDEARNLAKFQHPNIVRVSNFIKANGTAYFVMDYAEGEELGEWLKANPASLNEEAILNIVTPLLDGLAAVHETGLLHRDIKPGNIFLRTQGGPLLIDFGAARQALGEHSKSISAIISQGYAPPEQYTSRGKQGPYTDLYALGATLYYLITDKSPVESVDRSHEIHEGEPDPMLPASEVGKGKVSDWLLQLTDQLLAISPKQRPQSAQAVLEAIKNKTTAVIDAAATQAAKASNNKTRVIKDGERFSTAATRKTSPAAQSKTNLYSGIAAAVIVAVGAGYFFSQQTNDGTSGNDKAKSIASQKQNKTLAKGKAILFVESSPSGAEVYLDNNLLGKTPYQADNLPQGVFELTLKHETRSDLTESLQLTDNLVVKKKLTLKAATGNYSVFSTPTGASITIDGKNTNKKTPASLSDITAGEHSLSLSKDAYYPIQQSIYIRKGETLRGDFTLEGGDLVKHNGKWMKPEEKASSLEKIEQASKEAERKAIAEVKRNAVEKKRIAAAIKEKERKIKLAEKNRIAEMNKLSNGVPVLKVGDTWVMKVSSGSSSPLKFEQTQTVIKETIYQGQAVYELKSENTLGKDVTTVYMSKSDLSQVAVKGKAWGMDFKYKLESGAQWPMKVGGAWRSRLTITTVGSATPTVSSVENKVVALETINLGPGKFECFRVEQLTVSSDSEVMQNTWWCPKTKYFGKMSNKTKLTSSKAPAYTMDMEMISYKVSH